MPRGGRLIAMDCVGCGSAAVTERPDLTAQGYRLTAQGYRRFRCQDCGKQFNERSDGVLNRASLPSDIIAFVVFCRLRYRLTLRDRSEIMLLRGFTVSHERIRQWEAKLLPVMGEALRKRRHATGRSCGQSWYVDDSRAGQPGGSMVALSLLWRAHDLIIIETFQRWTLIVTLFQLPAERTIARSDLHYRST
jgi:transposase-like protein